MLKKLKIPKNTFSPIDSEDLQARLEIGLVRFKYVITTDKAAEPKGSVREAYGTRNLSMSFIDFDDIPQGIIVPPPHVMTYFDVDRDAWRCCVRSAMFQYDDIIEIEE